LFRIANVNTLCHDISGTSAPASRSLRFVVHVVRHEEVIRIISARHATPAERRLYEER